MTPHCTLTPPEPVAWLPDGAPYSARFGDVYRSRSGGLAQARTVFLGGCGLPQGWRGREACTLLETGFGLGLNFLTTWAAWQADAQRSSRLHFLSVEAFPVASADLLHGARALRAEAPADAALLPRVQALAAELAAAWGALQPGLQTLAFEQGRVQLTLAVGEVQPMLAQLPGPVDAVYLDGFSPALNPAMWSADTLAAVARLCHPGSRLASWCVAGNVRARLQALGFEVRKAAGLPPKRHRLEAIFRPESAAA